MATLETRSGPRAAMLRSAVIGIVPFLPAVGVLAVWLWAIHVKGAYFPRDSYPLAIGLVLLTVAAAVGARRALPPSRAARVALLAFAGLVGWSYLSLLWAESPGSALDAANELLLYLATAWSLSLVPWTPRSALALLGAWALGVATVCALSLLSALDASDLTGVVLLGRYSDPIGYTNATAAIAAMSLWPALIVSYRREVPALLQPVFLGVAVFLAGFSLIPQSRASLAALALSALVFLVVVPDRFRLLPRLLVLGAAAALVAGPALDVYAAATEDRPIPPVLDAAAERIGITVAAAVAAGALLVLAERLLRPSEATVRRSRQGVAAIAAALLIVGTVAAAANAGRISSSVGDRWDSLTSDTLDDTKGSARLGTLDPQERVDYWRVALELFEDHPIAGVGSGNYERHYTAERRREKHSRFAHSLPLRVLSEGGAVGALLLVGFLALLAVGLVAGYRRAPPAGRAVVAGAVAVGAYFILHASVDWLDEIPAVAAPVAGLSFVALRAVAPPGDRTPGPPRARGWRILSVAAPATVALAAMVALVPPYLAVRYVDRAFAGYRDEPRAAFRDLDRAATLNPLSARPRTSEGTIALALGHRSRARRAFERSLEMEANPYPHLELALMAAERGRFAEARRHIELARRLDRRDHFVAEARRAIVRRRRIDPAAFNRRIQREAMARFTRPGT